MRLPEGVCSRGPAVYQRRMGSGGVIVAPLPRFLQLLRSPCPPDYVYRPFCRESSAAADHLQDVNARADTGRPFWSGASWEQDKPILEDEQAGDPTETRGGTDV